ISHQIFNIRIEADENKAPVVVHSRRRLEAHLASVEAFTVTRLIRYSYQLTLIVEGPSMVETLQSIGVSLVTPTNQRTSVGAGVQKTPPLAIAPAHEEKRPPRHVAAPVIAWILNLGLVAQIQPAFVKNSLLLHLKNFKRCHSRTMDSEDTRFGVVYDKAF